MDGNNEAHSDEQKNTEDQGENTGEESKETSTGTDAEQLKAEIEKLQGINKRLKTKLEKSKEDKSTEQKSEADIALLQKAFLRSAGLTDKDEVEFALSKAKKWDMQIDELVDDDDFKTQLDNFRTKQSNLKAASDVKGDKSGSNVKNTPEYWKAKGVPPSREDVPDRKERAKIARALMKESKSSKTFYSD